MKISIQKSGFLVPVPVSVQIDTSSCSDDDAATVHALVRAVDNAPAFPTEEQDSSVYHIVADEVTLSAVEGTPGGTAAEQLLNFAILVNSR
jgi:hypothetical protein